eukprot:351634-Chlamydomonas_euryale.AAC.6
MWRATLPDDVRAGHVRASMWRATLPNHVRAGHVRAIMWRATLPNHEWASPHQAPRTTPHHGHDQDARRHSNQQCGSWCVSAHADSQAARLSRLWHVPRMPDGSAMKQLFVEGLRGLGRGSRTAAVLMARLVARSTVLNAHFSAGWDGMARGSTGSRRVTPLRGSA